jgi:hypothetical protein
MTRKSDNAGFVTRRFKTKLNAPPIAMPWVWMTHEFLESGAYRALSISYMGSAANISAKHSVKLSHLVSLPWNAEAVDATARIMVIQHNIG